MKNNQTDLDTLLLEKCNKAWLNVASLAQMLGYQGHVIQKHLDSLIKKKKMLKGGGTDVGDFFYRTINGALSFEYNEDQKKYHENEVGK